MGERIYFNGNNFFACPGYRRCPLSLRYSRWRLNRLYRFVFLPQTYLIHCLRRPRLREGEAFVYTLLMARGFEFAIDEFYHGYNRGNDKRAIFLDDDDKERFQKLLYLCNGTKALDFRAIPHGLSAYEHEVGEPLVAIGVYSLMSNHLHLLMKEIIVNGISIFMQKLGTAHTMFFNKKYDRSGSLFQGPFKAKHINNDRYLKYIYAYIHLNQVDLIEPGWKVDIF